jgi:hypothetical protein
LHQGLHAVKTNDCKLAKTKLSDCLNTGSFYDPRIRKAALEQLQSIFSREGVTHPRIQFLLKQFKNKKRDFIFMVDTACMSDNFCAETEKAIQQIVRKHVEEHDRVCLVKYGTKKYTDIVFSLVAKDKNVQ